MITEKTPRLLTIPQTAVYLSCAVWAVRSLLWARQVPYLKIGRRFLIDPKDLEKFIAASKN